jgi:catechol 2,3-dioxygenase-like lactoylglutathione lyase family enzyme
MSQEKFGPIAQIGMVTGDLDASIDQWINQLGVGPWTVFRNVTLNGEYRGLKTQIKMDVGLAYQGDTQVEFIHVTNGAICPYLAADGSPLSGLHHLAWMTDDLDETLERCLQQGFQLVLRAESPGTRVAYLEMIGGDGQLFEFIESALTKQMMIDGIAATRLWDGSNPIHIIDFEA